MRLISICNKIIEYSFYGLFLFVPLFFTNVTSELFELNKMWLTWGLTIVIAIAWFTKMTIARTFKIQRTPFDIPLLLFLLSQLISTIFSLDSRVSFWGYYSRFNGGFLSLFSYIFLFYAFISNLEKRHALRLIYISIIAGLIVVLWGLPSHFGYDLTCLIFRGTYNVSCWTDAFRPTIRAFSSLGQPAWLAAYLALLIPLSVALLLSTLPIKKIILKTGLFVSVILLSAVFIVLTAASGSLLLYILGICIAIIALGMLFYKTKQENEVYSTLTTTFFGVISFLFYLMLIFANTRAGIIGFWAGNIFFWVVLFFQKYISRSILIRYAIGLNSIFLLINFIFGTGIAQLDKYTLPELLKKNPQSLNTQQKQTQANQPSANTLITDSGKIRLYVWQGAIEAWKANPIFGTGVETFAFAYYKHRPVGHNLTSEWDYLYNKAHNEYLNYLTTTGIVGLGSYILFIATFLFLVIKNIFIKSEKSTTLPLRDNLLSIALVAGFITILITNFFGFSVVIINLYFFFIPLLYIFLQEAIPQKYLLITFNKDKKRIADHIGPYQWTLIALFGITGFYLLFLLLKFYQADVAYALGYNFNRVGEVQQAYLKLTEAVKMRPSEPIFKDEYAVNLATLGTALIQNNQATAGSQLVQQAISLSDDITTTHPNNVVYWKSRVRIFYLLSQLNPQYLKEALRSIEKAHDLAPTDAKISYNLGVIAGQNNELQKAVDILTQTIKMKPNYRDAYFARGLFYYQLATDSTGKVINPSYYEKAVSDMQHILKYIDKNDQTVIKTLESWGEK